MRLLALSASLLVLAALHAAPATAADADCSQFGSLASKNSNQATKVTFVNKTPELRIIMWIDYNGGTQQFASLDPGKKWTVNTFVSHPWMVTDGPGNCYRIYMPRSTARSVNLTEWGWGGGD